MLETIKTIHDLCTGCNRCVRDCPMELANITYQDGNGRIRVKVDNAKCVACGRCVTACKHAARYYDDDTASFFEDLAAGAPISLIAAPSIRTSIPEYRRLFRYLKDLGVRKIYDVSLGADISTWAYVRYIERNGTKPIITQPCPAIVSYCEIYRHDLLEYLAPVQSPMACVSIYMREHEGINDRIATLSPCIAKSSEFESKELVYYNVTFNKLIAYMKNNRITLPDEPAGYDSHESGLGSIFSMPGGLKENIEFFAGKSLRIDTFDGRGVFQKLDAFAGTQTDSLPRIFDVLSCDGGCNEGPACPPENNFFEIGAVMDGCRKAATDESKKAYYESLRKKYDETFNLSSYMRSYKPANISFPQIGDEDIERAYKSLGKLDDEKRNVDCNACGSDTCYEMARKIALGVNIPMNCIVKSRDDAREEHEKNLIAHQENIRQLKETENQRRLLESTVQANNAKSAFLANMSHEMRTPMNAIIGMTSIGLSTSELWRKDECLTRISDASKHLLGVINDVLDMSKIEAGKFEISPVEFDFEKMLQQIVTVIGFRIEEKHQKFKVYIDRKIPSHLIGDDQRIAQVILNLLSNAVKFTPENGLISLNTFFLGEEDGSCDVKISVSDTGIGISPELQSSLFQSFQQLESGISRKYGGSGLGLSISKNLVEMMGGEIWMEPNEGGGSRFIFTVKVKRGNSVISDSDDEKALNWNNIRILAVDDDPLILSDFKGIVGRFGAICDIASGAEEALRLVAKNGLYDFCFVDWRMPEINGIELTKEMRLRNSAQGDSVVIMISSAEYSSVAEEAKAAGVDKFLRKPLFPSSIMDVINEYIGIDRRFPREAYNNLAAWYKDRCIILAEDVEINREIVQVLLEPTLLNIDCATTGQEAYEMFCAAPHKYDMIFMDLQMPVLDGIGATRLIRALDIPRAKTIPIVAMTANVFREDVEKCLEAGMNDHVGKPLDLDIVLSKLHKYLGDPPSSHPSIN